MAIIPSAMAEEPLEIAAFLANLDGDRAEALRAVREAIVANLQPGFLETVNDGMIRYVVASDLYPKGYPASYGKPLGMAALSSGKTGMALHMFGLYCDPTLSAWFHDAYVASGKKLDMGAASIRFKRLEDLPLDVVGALFAKVTVEKFVTSYARALGLGQDEDG